MSLGSAFARNASLASCYGDDKSTAAGWPTTLTARLYDGDPTSGGTEMSGGGYAGVAVANTTAVMGAPVGGVLGPIDIEWPASTGAWSGGTPPTHAAFTDGSGHILDYGAISANPGISDVGQIFSVDAVVVAL